MTLEEVTAAAEQELTVIQTHMGIDSRCKISGVITRYSKQNGWTYLLELTEIKSRCIIIADLDQVRLETQ